ncbi:MAG: DUF1295 domain-containing protein [Chitinophagales bacterium]
MDIKTNFTYIWIALGIITFFYLLKFKTAPYGRHTSKNWGPMIDNKLGWILMESPALILFLFFALQGFPAFSNPVIVFIALWCIHYFNRTFIFPFRTKTKGKKMPLIIALSAIGFNSINTWLIGTFINENALNYSNEWFTTPQFIIGLFVFLTGFFMNQSADNTLLNLRKPGETDYKIPQGKLFKYISSPNLIGEIIEWIGFFIMTWHLATFTFALWTIANLAPRIVSHHKWYLEKFENYPKERKAFCFF